MKTALVTGANKGIGYEVAKQMAELGYYVYLGSRNLERGLQAAETLKKEGLENVEAVSLDVLDLESIKRAQVEIEAKGRGLDVLVNNAGISLIGQAQDVYGVTKETILGVFDVNYFGVIHTTQVFLDMLRKSDSPRIVNVTSDLGSLTLQSDPTWQHGGIKPVAYMASKAALNAYTIALAYALKDSNFKVNSANPGSTATDLNNHLGARTPEHAAKIIVKCATLSQEEPSGQFYSEEGILPW